MIQRQRDNPCIGRAPNPLGRKSAHEQAQIRNIVDCFFDIRGVIYIDWVPEGQTVNQVYYKKVLTTLRERVRRGRPVMWKNAHGFFITTTRQHTTRCFFIATPRMCVCVCVCGVCVVCKCGCVSVFMYVFVCVVCVCMYVGVWCVFVCVCVFVSVCA